MKQAAISLGLVLGLLAAPAVAQTVAAGARAIVTSDALPVYAAMSDSGAPKATLKRGEHVVIGMVLFGSETTWCAISHEGETKRFGYASCEFLEPLNASAPAATSALAPAPVLPPPATATPTTPSQPPKAKTKPPVAKIREIPSAPIVIHELAPATVAPPVPVAIAPPAPKAVTPPLPPMAPKPEEKEPQDVAQAVLDGSSLRAEIASYTEGTRLSAFLDKGRLAAIDGAALDRVLAAQFQPQAFVTAISGQIRKSDSTTRLPALLHWVQSDEARKLAGLEQRAYSPVSHQSLVDYAATLSTTPPPESRLLLIHRIYDGARTCDMEVEATIALVYTTAEAITPALPADKRYSSNELDRALGPVKSRYRSIIKNARIVHYLFAFQSASDAELEQYAGFLESDSGKWLTSAIDKGFFEATESVSRHLREEIPRHVKTRGN